MATDAEIEVFRALRSAQDRYDYFLLAAAGAAIAFALNQTHDKALAWTQVPLATAAFCWGLSFYCGCRHLLLVNATLWSNGELLRVQSGNHPLTGQHLGAIQVATESIHESLRKTQNHSSKLAQWQFALFLIGGALYITWHVLEMYLRIPPH